MIEQKLLDYILKRVVYTKDFRTGRIIDWSFKTTTFNTDAKLEKLVSLGVLKRKELYAKTGKRTRLGSVYTFNKESEEYQVLTSMVML